MPDLDAHAGIRLLIVASVRLYRDGLASNLERPPLHVVDTATTAEDAFARATALAPDVVVLDMALPDSLALVRALRDRMREVRVVTYAVDECEPAILACVEAGVAGFVSSDGTADDLVNAVHGAARGEMFCSPRAVGALSRRLHSLAAAAPAADVLAALTAREREILSLVERGLANKEIACRLHIELATVKNHVHSILEKLGVGSRSEAAARARTGPPTFRPRRSGEHAEPSR
jgi:DNA-binding NarL/FixJ family response regulator